MQRPVKVQTSAPTVLIANNNMKTYAVAIFKEARAPFKHNYG